MRQAIDAGAAIASGKYIMKLDGHCALDKGFDEKLKADCETDWVVIPRRYSLDAEKWQRQKAPIDYLYLSYPDDPQDFGGAGKTQVPCHLREYPELAKGGVLHSVIA